VKNQSGENKVVFVGMSGGVDSAVSAALLQEQGYDVRAVFMKNFSGVDFGVADQCPWEEDQASALAAAEHLGIPFRTYNFEKEYRQQVVDYFFAEFARGRTPNPDVMCNKTIKFNTFLQRALADGADMIATGHYARIHNADSQYQLLKGLDVNKDQTYFLHTFTQDQLSKTFFPVGHLPKPEVRALAAKFGLPNAVRLDSQGICFIGEIDLIKFLKSQIPEKPGEIRDIDTDEVIGEHTGVYFYTIGQRNGLNLGGFGVPYFVVDKDVEQNILYAAKGSRHESLFNAQVELESIHTISGEPAETLLEKDLTASVRYRQVPQPGRLKQIAGKMIFVFNEAQRAITPGQSLVIYDDEICLGGSVITGKFKGKV
jgi:tRNA-specific 2-thiouridylase